MKYTDLLDYHYPELCNGTDVRSDKWWEDFVAYLVGITPEDDPNSVKFGPKPDYTDFEKFISIDDDLGPFYAPVEVEKFKFGMIESEKDAKIDKESENKTGINMNLVKVEEKRQTVVTDGNILSTDNIPKSILSNGANGVYKAEKEVTAKKNTLNQVSKSRKYTRRAKKTVESRMGQLIEGLEPTTSAASVTLKDSVNKSSKRTRTTPIDENHITASNLCLRSPKPIPFVWKSYEQAGQQSRDPPPQEPHRVMAIPPTNVMAPNNGLVPRTFCQPEYFSAQQQNSLCVPTWQRNSAALPWAPAGGYQPKPNYAVPVNGLPPMCYQTPSTIPNHQQFQMNQNAHVQNTIYGNQQLMATLQMYHLAAHQVCQWAQGPPILQQPQQTGYYICDQQQLNGSQPIYHIT